jgi:hypothetical protein
MRSKRKVVVKLIQNEQVHNARLVEYFANRVKERCVEYGASFDRS